MDVAQKQLRKEYAIFEHAIKGEKASRQDIFPGTSLYSSASCSLATDRKFPTCMAQK